jgi:hypothetical protein
VTFHFWSLQQICCQGNQCPSKPSDSTDTVRYVASCLMNCLSVESIKTLLWHDPLSSKCHETLLLALMSPAFVAENSNTEALVENGNWKFSTEILAKSTCQNRQKRIPTSGPESLENHKLIRTLSLYPPISGYTVIHGLFNCSLCQRAHKYIKSVSTMVRATNNSQYTTRGITHWSYYFAASTVDGKRR